MSSFAPASGPCYRTTMLPHTDKWNEALVEDKWIDGQAVTHHISEIEDCAIAIDATYYLQSWLDHEPYYEPLVPALAGLASIQKWIEADLDSFEAHRITPFFIFDGQPITGQDEISVMRGLHAIKETDGAWVLYFNGDPQKAVEIFGENPGAFRVQSLYPLLQGILKQRKLHFLVPPYNAAAQMAYFEMIDSEQCAGVMGSQELLLYPIKDCVIRKIDWENKAITAISKKHILKALNIPEPVFIDAFLMTGTSFLAPFPPLMDVNIIKTQPFTIGDAVNILRTANKEVAQACNSFSDILKGKDADWLDKYRKARMTVSHFIYIAENGEVQVHDYERLTSDNHEYLGLQLPWELFHYLNTGLIGPRLLGWITHSQLQVLPTLDGVASNEYRKLVSKQLVPIKETALGLVMSRLNRAIGYKNITMKVWYDRQSSSTLWDRHESSKAGVAQKVSSWTIQPSAIKEHYPKFEHGSVASEIFALKNPEFVKATVSNGRTKGLEPADLIISIAIWRFLHLREYIDDSHQLTPWGSALATAMSSLEPVVKKNPGVQNLYESLLLAFELLRFDLLNAKGMEDLTGEAMNGSEDEQGSMLLISRCASVLRLRHEDIGYTGPLSKTLLAYHSLVAEVRSADRDLVEGIVASMFLYAQTKRHRDDNWELSHRLPFLYEPDVSMAIAMKTWLNNTSMAQVPAAERMERMMQFKDTYVPHSTNLFEDIQIGCAFFDAIHAGVKALDAKAVTKADRAAWDRAADYLASRQ